MLAVVAHVTWLTDCRAVSVCRVLLGACNIAAASLLAADTLLAHFKRAQARPPAVSSCLVAERCGMTRALLEVIAAGVVETPDDVAAYLACRCVKAARCGVCLLTLLVGAGTHVRLCMLAAFVCWLWCRRLGSSSSLDLCVHADALHAWARVQHCEPLACTPLLLHPLLPCSLLVLTQTQEVASHSTSQALGWLQARQLIWCVARRPDCASISSC